MSSAPILSRFARRRDPDGAGPASPRKRIPPAATVRPQHNAAVHPRVLIRAVVAAAAIGLAASAAHPPEIRAAAGITRLTHAAGRDVQGSFSPDGRRIAFVSNRGGSWQIWVLRSDGSGARRLTSHAEPVGGPSWAPGGEWILYYVATAAGSRLFRVAAAGGEPAALLEDVSEDGLSDYRPSLSPDGTRLLFDRHAAGSTDHDLYVRDLASGELEVLAPAPGYDSDARWSPDGKRIVFHSDRDGSRRFDTDVYVVAADGGGLRRLTRGGGAYPAWSPDGARIVYVAETDGNRDLWTAGADGGAPQRLTEHPASDSEPSFSPDGREILFSSTRYSGEEELCLLRLEP